VRAEPPVIAEIVGGIILGPTVMGYVPGFTDNIFPEHSMEVFHTFAEVGLVFFMFLIGMEVDPQLFRRKLGPSLVISLTAMGFTFMLSLGASAYIYQRVPSGASYLEAILFTGVATAITAFPVLARILADQNLMQSKVGVTALSVAAIDDVTYALLLICVRARACVCVSACG
jgi:Kef-type K+ transport system membrane component KefB